MWTISVMPSRKHDPANAAVYAANAEAYKARITATIDPCAKQLPRYRKTSAGW